MLVGFEMYLQERFDRTSTQKAYKRDAETFVSYVESEGLEWSDIKERHITQYNRQMKQAGFSDHSIARKNSSLRLFFKYLRKQGVMSHNPMEDIKQPSLESREVSLTREEKKRLEERMKKEDREYVLYTLLVEEKIKVSELVQLKWSDVDVQNGILYLPRKACTVQPHTIERIQKLPKREQHTAILCNQKGEPITVNGVHYLLKRHFREIGREDVRPNDLAKQES